MKPNLNNTAGDYARSSARGFSHQTINGGTSGDALSLAPGFSRVESGRGNEKTVSAVFLKRATVPEYQ